MQVFALYDTYYHFEGAFNIILQKNKANILIVSCSLHLQGDPNYIYLIQFEPQIRQSITSCSETKASELVPCSLLPYWNSMRFFATVSLYD